MSIPKRSLVIGLFVSLVAHGALFLPNLITDRQMVKQKETKVQGKVALSSRSIAKKETVQEKRVEPEEKSSSEMEQLKEMVKARKTIPSKSKGDFASVVEKDSVPELKLTWDDSRQLLDVARNLGMRILAANSNDIVGELNITGVPYIEAFDGKVSNFSNRVRTVPASFFGSSLIENWDKNFNCFIVLVPSTVDQQWLSEQRSVLNSKGLRGSQISYMEAKIVWNGHAYELVITKMGKA